MARHCAESQRAVPLDMPSARCDKVKEEDAKGQMRRGTCLVACAG
jgi:hypothetical protein